MRHLHSTLLWELFRWHSNHRFVPLCADSSQYLCNRRLYLQHHTTCSITVSQRASVGWYSGDCLQPGQNYSMLTPWIICAPNNPWVYPLWKRNGGWHPCGDVFVHLTMQMYLTVIRSHTFMIYPTACGIRDFLSLVPTYHLNPTAFEDIPKNAVTTPSGLHKFLRIPFSLRNPAQTFQTFIDHMLRCLNFAFAYTDDVLSASTNKHKPRYHPCFIFQCF